MRLASVKIPAGRPAGVAKNWRNLPPQPRPAFSFVSERLFISEVSVFIKCSEPDALSLAQILIMTAGLLRQRTPEIFATPAGRPAGHFPKKGTITIFRYQHITIPLIAWGKGAEKGLTFCKFWGILLLVV